MSTNGKSGKKSRDKKIYTKAIEFVFHEPNILRGMIEILSKIKDTFYFRFSPSGITVEEKSMDKSVVKTITRWEFLKGNMIKYYYNVIDSDGDPVDTYSYHLEVMKFKNAIKEGGKQISFRFSLDICSDDLSNNGLKMNIMNNNGGCLNKGIRVIKEKVNKKNSRPPKVSNVYTYYYEDLEPNGKFTLVSLAYFIKTYKTSKYSHVGFTLSENGIICIEGRNEKNVEEINTLSDRVDAPDDDYSSSDDDDEDDDDDGASDASNNENDLVYIFKRIGIDWLQKITTLCHSGIAKIYMKQDCPMLIFLHLGNYGTCTLSFS